MPTPLRTSDKFPPELLTNLVASFTKESLKGRYVFARYFINSELKIHCKKGKFILDKVGDGARKI